MLVPLIQYSSMFVLTSNIIKYYVDPEVHAASINFVKLDQDRDGPTFYDLFYFYSLFKNAIQVENINEMYQPYEKNIDLRKLILFGLLKGFLKKLNKYPISLQDPNCKIPDENKKSLTGIYNLDKICSTNGKLLFHIEIGQLLLFYLVLNFKVTLSRNVKKNLTRTLI